MQPCDFCDGTGSEDGPGFEWPIRCPVCDGTGIEPEPDDYETEMENLRYGKLPPL